MTLQPGLNPETMNKQQWQFTASRARLGGKRLALLIASCLCAMPVRAELPAPDNILYGTITIGSQPVAEADTNVVVEARRTAGGAAIASYRMGSDPGAGSFYRLKIPLEELSPITDSPDSSLAGDRLVLVVRNASGVQAQLPYVIPERGHAQRLDFGTTVLDSDNDGLPDVWELATFGNLGNNGSSTNNNGRTSLDNFVTGSDPSSLSGLVGRRLLKIF